jgi:hypothetical protein
VARRTPTGRPMCPNCYRMDRYRNRSYFEKCAECGKLRPVETRNSKRQSICPYCYDRLARQEVNIRARRR